MRGWSLSGGPTVESRKNEVKQQQDWRLVFLDRPETYRITDCLDELSVRTLALTEICCPGVICATGGLSVVSHEVRLRKVQIAPELCWASLAQRVC